jgi:hypothetical protein
MCVIIVVRLGCVKLVIRECGWIVDKSAEGSAMVIEHFLELLAHFRELVAQPLNLMGCSLVSIAVWATTIVATCRIPKLFDDIVGHVRYSVGR